MINISGIPCGSEKQNATQQDYVGTDTPMQTSMLKMQSNPPAQYRDVATWTLYDVCFRAYYPCTLPDLGEFGITATNSKAKAETRCGSGIRLPG